MGTLKSAEKCDNPDVALVASSPVTGYAPILGTKFIPSMSEKELPMPRENDLLWSIALPVIVIVLLASLPFSLRTLQTSATSTPYVPSQYPPVGYIRPEMARILLRSMYRRVNDTHDTAVADSRSSALPGDVRELGRDKILYSIAVDNYNAYVRSSIGGDLASRVGFPTHISADPSYYVGPDGRPVD